MVLNGPPSSNERDIVLNRHLSLPGIKAVIVKNYIETGSVVLLD